MPPSLTERDTLERSEGKWQSAASSYRHLKREADAAAKLLESAKKRLIGLAQHTSETGCGVTVTSYWKPSSIDYKRIPALDGVDVEGYRRAGHQEIRVTYG